MPLSAGTLANCSLMNTEELNASATTLAPEEAGTAMLVAIADVGAEMSPVTTSYSAIL